jgi:predicted HNH restriction endonuclease
LKIYLRTNETNESEWQAVASAHGVSPEKRKTIKRPWESRTPFFVFVDSTTTQAGSVLLLKAAGIEAPASSVPIEYPSETSAREFEEGGRRTVTVNTYERDPAARQECIGFFGCLCAVCGFDFKASYGDIGNGFIHVHHLVPVAQIGKRYQVVPNRDMLPVCPNGHEMLHMKTPPFTIEEMRDVLRSTGRLKV